MCRNCRAGGDCRCFTNFAFTGRVIIVWERAIRIYSSSRRCGGLYGGSNRRICLLPAESEKWFFSGVVLCWHLVSNIAIVCDSGNGAISRIFLDDKTFFHDDLWSDRWQHWGKSEKCKAKTSSKKVATRKLLSKTPS